MNLASRLYTLWNLRKTPFPPRLQIETTNACNAACHMCPILEMERPKGFMSDETWSKIVAELADQPPLRRVILHVMGEPLLHPSFTTFVKVLREEAPHQPVEFSTNGSLLTEKAVQAFIEAGVEQINFSLDAMSPETHAKIRKGLNFQKVIANLEMLIKTMAASGKAKPKILIQLIKMDINKDEWEEFSTRWTKFAAKHRFLEVYIKEQWSWGGHLDSGQARMEEAKAFLSLPCSFPFDQLDVYWDGRVGFCCLDEDVDLKVGDLADSTLEQIWHSSELEAIRKRFRKGDFSGLRCAGCGERLRHRSLDEIGERPRAMLKKIGLG